jgi:hypothetical protein
MAGFQGVRGGVGYSDTASDEDSKRRNQLAQLMLQQSNAAPAVGVTGALNKILSGAIAGWQMGKDSEEQKARGEARNATLADALRASQGQAAETKAYGDGTTINWDERKGDPSQMAAILSGNPDTADMGMQMQVSQMDEKRRGEVAATAALLKRQHDLEDEYYKPIKTEDGSVIIPAMMPGFQMPGRAPAQAAPQAPQPPDLRTMPTAPNPGGIQSVALPPPDTSRTPGYVAQVKGLENGTGDPAARNPRSSAMGDGQFIAATWLDIVKRNRPDIAQGKSDADILALRADPKLSAEMTDVYGMENADALRSGGVQNVGNAEKYAAHFFGPGGAIKVLTADQNAPLSDILGPGVIKANPQLAKLTAGQWRTANSLKFGGGQAPQEAPQQPKPVQVADAGNGIPAGALPPGVLYQGNKGGGGLFSGPGDKPAMRNLYIQLQTKVANGEPLSQQEQLAMELIQQEAQQPRLMTGERGEVISVPGMPLPTIPGRQPAVAPPVAQAAATDTVPNPLTPAPAAAAPAPVPASPQQPTVVVPRAAKEIPEKVNNGMLENVNAIRKVDEALAAIEKTPEATGFGVGALNAVTPNAVTNFAFPEGANARALISEIGSMKIHDRAGASQTAG